MIRYLSVMVVGVCGFLTLGVRWAHAETTFEHSRRFRALSLGTQNASFAISNFDGKNFAAAGRVPLTGANYAATFGGTVVGFNGRLN